MAEGTIIKWFGDRQSGFIKPDDNSGDVKFFADNLRDSNPSQISVGKRVRYKLRQNAQRPTTAQFSIIGNAQMTNKYQFLNPYNFVRLLREKREGNNVLGNCPPPPHDRYVGLTGRITCEVEAVTPLFISDSHAVKEEKEENGHKIYRFFQLDGKPVDGKPALPASSLRGMFRSVFETITNSCFVAFTKDKYPMEYRQARAPEMTPARLLDLNESGATFELLDCTINAPCTVAGRPTVVRAGAVVRSYPPRVLNQQGLPFDFRKSQLPNNVHDRTRVAALINQNLITHRSERYRYFEVVQVVPSDQHGNLQVKPNQKKVFGWLHLTGPNIENKHDERLFFRWDDSEPEAPAEIPNQYKVRCDKSIVDEYNHHLSEYFERNQRDVEKIGNRRWPNSNEGVPHPSTFVEKGRKLKIGDLVYVQKNTQGKVTLIRSVSIPRLRYKKRRQELIPSYYHRCIDYENLCPACRTFGWVHEDSGEIRKDIPTAYAGRVRFSHGSLTHDAGRLSETTLAILSSPKPTTTMFYLLNANGQPDANVDYDTTPNAQLRGRKFYRHFGEKIKEQEYQRADGTRNDQNRTVRDALNPGAKFEFSLDFENLAAEELDALLYALELEDGRYHRLGYAKPLGFGSVKVTVKEVQTINWAERLQSIEPNAGWQTLPAWQGYRQRFLDAMQTMYGEAFQKTILADLHALLGAPPNLPIHYPRSSQKPNAEGKNFEWFMGNKTRRQPLPLAPNDTQGFEVWDKRGDKVNE